jgi:MFS superfamily sulfate permease-like transporter
MSLYCWIVVIVFFYTTGTNILERTDGIIIAAFFILFILLVSGLSRYSRAKELRVEGHRFRNPESERIWRSMVGRKVNLIPISSLNPKLRAAKARKIRRFYKIDGPLAFVSVSLLDNRSEFLSPIELEVKQDGDQYTVQASQAVAIANGIAYLSELLHPISIFLGLTRQNMMRQSLRFFLMGEGEIGLMVYTILLHFWEKTRIDDERPYIFLMSD